MFQQLIKAGIRLGWFLVRGGARRGVVLVGMYVDEWTHVNHELIKHIHSLLIKMSGFVEIHFLVVFLLISNDTTWFSAISKVYLQVSRDNHGWSQSQVGFNLRYWLHCEAAEYEHGSSRCVPHWFRSIPESTLSADHLLVYLSTL